MQPLAIDPRILRTLLGPEINVVPGRALMARVVAADGTGRGSLSIAGFLLDAELPSSVRTGQDLRLVVRDVSPERVLLGVSDEHPAGAPLPVAAPPPPPEIPLPGGGSVSVTEREARRPAAGGQESHHLTLRYEAPTLGSVDLHLALNPATMAVTVTVPRAALEAAQAASDELRAELGGALGRTASVTIAPRREPLDVYA